MRKQKKIEAQLATLGLDMLKGTPASQRYYWTPEWQKGEREALEDLRAGRIRRFKNALDAIKWLNEEEEEEE